ncbi:HU family DNA-binding protein [Chlorobium sp. N1]|uniref:SPOR domain-containing protein n=1 Tax=Chlorobium sp. N1 TaxID=2491138 RepID=UPI001039E883|nr:HU family DNA-binding protein [Chlorobium sp. N1]TCD47918.1 hypothetical protein E0L29_06470 [Chlorobium sp. N1]
MAASDCIERLSGLLGLERDRARSLLSRFSAAMASALLDGGAVSVRGLGSFSVSYSAPSRMERDGERVYTPPSNTLAWQRQTRGDDTLQLLRTGLALEEDEARKIARALKKAFTATLRRREPLLLSGFGRFELSEKNRVRFRPESGLLELANGSYEGLASIPMASPVRRRMAVPALVALFAVLAAFVGGFLAFRSGTIAGLPQAPLGWFRPEPARVAAPSLPPPPPVVAPPAPAEGVLLDEGEFTIVLATFSLRSTALRELSRLDSSGVVSAVWPAWQAGRKYWRLRTGRYRDRSEAVEAMHAMPHAVAGGAYIQKVIKRVVSHGEKEL